MIQDGTYLVKDGKIENYAERWAHGFIVAKGYEGHKTTRTIDLEVPIVNVAIRRDSHLIGVWTNPEDGVVHIEPVDHVESIERARALATVRGESHVYDLFLGKVTKTEDL